ncbi:MULTISPECIES: sulfite exporter TauE/SafE family protein [Catenuloplanes]|uniref:Probable membrane transporter protein n=1 Tax=Catenuloplanes niger TaxID=587534 RepID=A0AAE3ZHB3_9ACTN|nr:sulfite exporter TauE/SafE family protein [Catenuloplanes niger]MDR7319972.1 putative membrane protein YfcA [Catenuloplanes niger]
MSGWAYALLSVTVVLAGCLQGSIGFGMGMVAAPVVAIVDPTLLPGMLIMLAAVLTLIVTIRERDSINLAGAGWALAGRVPGTAAGVALVALLPRTWLSLLLGAVIIFGVVSAIGGWSPEPTRRTTALAGAASGMLGTATSIGGPPMALVWQRSTGAGLRGTMSTFFLAGSLMSLAGLLAAGQIGPATLRTTLWFLPATLAGYLLSRYVNRFMSRARLRATAIVTSLAGATALIVNQLV